MRLLQEVLGAVVAGLSVISYLTYCVYCQETLTLSHHQTHEKTPNEPCDFSHVLKLHAGNKMFNFSKSIIMHTIGYKNRSKTCIHVC